MEKEGNFVSVVKYFKEIYSNKLFGLDLEGKTLTCNRGNCTTAGPE